MKEFVDRTEQNQGTPINRANMLAVQGFESKKTEFFADGMIKETNSNGEVKETRFTNNGQIIETLVGEKTITKTTTFGSDGSITEELS